MDAIFKNGNVYVAVMDKYAREGIDFSESTGLVLCSQKDVTKKLLYGGRVKLYLHSYSSRSYASNVCYIELDGIQLNRTVLREQGNIELVSTYALTQAAAFLNQIENLGVDSFLENYKLQLQGLKSELEVQAVGLQQELALNYNENKAKVLDSIKKAILSLACIIFSLLVNMNTGLENHHYTEAYDNIINLYF
jgi:hypothetical protein